MIAEIRHSEVAQQHAAVGVRIGAHAARALRRQLGELRFQRPVGVEKFFSFVALHPAFEQLHMIWMLAVDQYRHLVRSEGAFDLQAVDDLRPGPALRRSAARSSASAGARRRCRSRAFF